MNPPEEKSASPVDLSDSNTPSAKDAPRSLKSGGVLMIASQAVKLPLQIGTTAILARLLSVDQFGLFSLVMPIVASSRCSMTWV